MRFDLAIDEYLDDRQHSGHITSQNTVDNYRMFLDPLARDVNNRDPSLVSFQEIKTTLRRWPNTNTKNHARTIYNGFYKWLVREGHAKTNPVDQIDAPRTKPRRRRRLTRGEIQAMMDACRNPRERWAIHLAGCSGLRNAEVRQLRGVHFSRPGFIWVSEDIGKGGRERWVPISSDLSPIAAEIVAAVTTDDLVLPSLRAFDPGVNGDMRPTPKVMSTEGLIELIAKIAQRAGIAHRVTPHALRHYFGEVVTAEAGIHMAQALLGHASIQTTQIYAGHPSPDDLQVAMRTIRFRLSAEMPALSVAVDRGPVISSQHELDRLRGFGRVLVMLRVGFRPLVRETAL